LECNIYLTFGKATEGFIEKPAQALNVHNFNFYIQGIWAGQGKMLPICRKLTLYVLNNDNHDLYNRG